MSHDPQSPSDAADMADDDYVPDALCERCGGEMDMTDVDVESFELTGKLLCPECATDYPDVAD
jgi:hypothetical protein